MLLREVAANDLYDVVSDCSSTALEDKTVMERDDFAGGVQNLELMHTLLDQRTTEANALTSLVLLCPVEDES